METPAQPDAPQPPKKKVVKKIVKKVVRPKSGMAQAVPAPAVKAEATVQGEASAAGTEPRVAAASARAFQRMPAWVRDITEGRPRVRTAMRWTLALSLAVHLGITPIVPRQQGLDAAQQELYESEYQKKIEAAKHARVVAQSIKGRIKMPPPPPDPEGVIQDTLTHSLTTDVEKVVGKLLDVKVTQKLAQQVAVSLQDELKAMAKDVVEGKLSEEEIKNLHKKYQQKAHEITVKALKEHRIETQEERAQMSTVDWYEKKVSATLLNNYTYELWHREYGRCRWGTMYHASHPHTHWGRVYLLDIAGFMQTLEALKAFEAEAKKKTPELGIEQAEFMVKRIAEIKKGVPEKNKNSSFSFDTAIDLQVGDYFPHRREELKPLAAGLKRDFQKAVDAAGRYLSLAQDEEAADEELETARKECFGLAAKIAGEMKALIPDAEFAKRAHTVNKALVSRVLREKEKDAAHKRLIDSMVGGLAPLIREFAQDQFKAGIIVWKEGVDDTMEDFTAAIVPLLQRDMQRLFPKKRFDDMVFEMSYAFGWKSKVTGKIGPPEPEDIQKDEAAFGSVVSEWSEAERAYVDARRAEIAGQLMGTIDRIKEKLLTLALSGDLLLRGMSTFVEGVDYADKVEERLDARAAALKGRGQDLTSLTADGVPDTSAPLVALLFGSSKGHGASLEPTATTMLPGYTNLGLSAMLLRETEARFPPMPALNKGVFPEQAQVQPVFGKSPRFEAIPFLTKFPRLDGDLSDWGRIRPLILKSGEQSLVLYAAWNYQGFFFGYQVKQPAANYYYPSLYQTRINRQVQSVAGTVKAEGVAWAFVGDHLRLYFDTLDARNDNRGEPHTQEFTILPRGTDSDEMVPGMERVIASQRDAKSKEYRGAKSTAKLFPQQPGMDQGPDGSGPYRATRFEEDGYTVEVFLPRTLFGVPVFAPGWYMGFDCAVATGHQGKSFKGFGWASRSNTESGERSGLKPNEWGDLLLLGSDPTVMVQNADGKYDMTGGLVPGHSYLLTVVDPDRNVQIGQKDTVLVSAEARGFNNDVEVYVLEETEKNSGVFRGFIDTQPGYGREAQGILEVYPGQEVGFGYVDFANAKGERNTQTVVRMPVVAGVMQARQKNGE